MKKTDILTFVGDVFYPQDTGKRLFAENIVYNQECVVSSNRDLEPVPDKVNLKTESDMAGNLFEKCANRYACVANNHILDYGEQGFRDTVCNLEEQGVHCFGENLDSVSVYTSGTIRFSLLAYYMNAFCGMEEIERKKAIVKKQVKEARDNGAKRVIVSFHFGNEHYPESTWQQQEVARYAIDNGADLVVGHHPHCIQEKENYKGKWIYYSLGNFVFPNFEVDAFFDTHGVSKQKFIWKNTKWTQKGMIVHFDLEKGKIDEEVFTWKKEGVDIIKKESLERKKTDKMNVLFGEMRKLYLLIYWNTFTNGQIINWKGIFYKFKSMSKGKRFRKNWKMPI